MADKVVWERRGLLIVQKDTEVIVADCRFRDPISTIETWKTNRTRGMEDIAEDVQEIVDLHNEFIKFKEPPSPEEWWASYHTEGCTCRQIPVANTILVGGQDDCSVHGFGTDTHYPQL